MNDLSDPNLTAVCREACPTNSTYQQQFYCWWKEMCWTRNPLLQWKIWIRCSSSSGNI